MCIVHHIKLFFFSGWNTFRSSAKGEYSSESEAVGAIRREMFSQPTGRLGDALKDRKSTRLNSSHSV